MNLPEIKNSEVVVFKPKDGQTEFRVLLDGKHDTVWATDQQIMDLFGKARRTVGAHIKNIYEEGELDREATWRELRQVQKEGGRKVSRKVAIYNLDVIISVGYRVKSKVGIEFRKWATQRLREYLLKGYSINQKLLHTERKKVKALRAEINSLNDELSETQKAFTSGLLSIISHYSKSFELLDKYDKNELSSDSLNKDVIYVINYKDVKQAVKELKSDLIQKGEAGDLFGNEKDDSFKGILGSISQTVYGELAYPTIEEQAVQLLYSIIKGHPFSDGNKRIGSFIFVWFLE
ncbi:MAG: virulence protein RhuM/Fic/DOC family protein, partial [Ekhidna sp.]|nr:virulence protein RhuM/Fic/DOC family protein [Ekhidna sp.]